MDFTNDHCLCLLRHPHTLAILILAAKKKKSFLVTFCFIIQFQERARKWNHMPKVMNFPTLYCIINVSVLHVYIARDAPTSWAFRALLWNPIHSRDLLLLFCSFHRFRFSYFCVCACLYRYRFEILPEIKSIWKVNLFTQKRNL